jgi:hypothetical protein
MLKGVITGFNDLPTVFLFWLLSGEAFLARQERLRLKEVFSMTRKNSWWLALMAIALCAIVFTTVAPRLNASSQPSFDPKTPAPTREQLGALSPENVFRPESYVPEWITTYPSYQRYIVWDFSGDPTLPANPPQYYGEKDPELKASDYVTFTGDVTWYGSADGGYSGVIGIDNRNGQVLKTGTAVFHIDNLNNVNILKHINEVIDWYEDNPWSDVDETNPLPGGVRVPPGFEITAGWWYPSWQISETPELWREPAWWAVQKNPPWEEKEIYFQAQPGYYAFVDSLTIWTECVPPYSQWRDPPSLTEWGVIILAALLAGTGVWVLIRRRSGRKARLA